MTDLAIALDSFTPAVRSEFLSSKNEGRLAGEVVVERHNSARASILETAVLISDALDRFSQSRDALDGFLAVLLEGRVLASADARLGENASKLAVYRKVGQHAKVLSHYSHYFDPSLYIFYDVARLFEDLSHDDQALEGKLKELAILGVSRESLQQAIRDQKPSKRRSTGSTSKSLVQVDGSPDELHQVDILSLGSEFSLVLATPSAKDLRLLQRDMSGSDLNTPRCMRVHEWTSTTAVLFAVSDVIDLPIVAHRLLQYCGFADVRHVFLLDSPKQHDITRCRALTVAVRGGYEVPVTRMSEAITAQLPLIELAEQFATNEDGRLHVFSDEPKSGWTCLSGQDNWMSEDVR